MAKDRSRPPDIDLILKCCEKAGIKVSRVGPGEGGGIYCNGEKIDDICEFIESCFKELSEEKP